MNLLRNAISTILCVLLVLTGTLCLCTTASAESASASLADSHHSYHESAPPPEDCSRQECPDCYPDALGLSLQQELKAQGGGKLELSPLETISAPLALGLEPPSEILLVSLLPPPLPHYADTPVRRWDLLLE